MPSLDISPEKVAWIIVRARHYEAQVPSFNSDADTAAEEHAGAMEMRAGHSTLRELVSFIRGLNEDEQANLVALAWLGRGSYEPEEWDAVVDRARRRRDVSTERYLLETPTLAGDLEAGLDSIGIRAAEFEDELDRI